MNIQQRATILEKVAIKKGPEGIRLAATLMFQVYGPDAGFRDEDEMAHDFARVVLPRRELLIGDGPPVAAEMKLRTPAPWRDGCRVELWSDDSRTRIEGPVLVMSIATVDELKVNIEGKCATVRLTVSGLAGLITEVSVADLAEVIGSKLSLDLSTRQLDLGIGRTTPLRVAGDGGVRAAARELQEALEALPKGTVVSVDVGGESYDLGRGGADVEPPEPGPESARRRGTRH